MLQPHKGTSETDWEHAAGKAVYQLQPHKGTSETIKSWVLQAA